MATRMTKKPVGRAAPKPPAKPGQTKRQLPSNEPRAMLKMK